MSFNKSKLAFGIFLLLFSVVCIASLAIMGYKSYLLTGAAVSAFVGVGFIRSARRS
ncbi:MAG: hypothetical protein FWG53_02520 [Clostridiales bacterium]|nr:hypothetical protein [Clostridiales bacterium]